MFLVVTVLSVLLIIGAPLSEISPSISWIAKNLQFTQLVLIGKRTFVICQKPFVSISIRLIFSGCGAGRRI